MHDEVSGVLVNRRKKELREKNEEVQAMAGDKILEEDRFLAEENFEDLEGSSRDKQTYWLLAMNRYKKRKKLREKRSRGAGKELENGSMTKSITKRQ